MRGTTARTEQLVDRTGAGLAAQRAQALLEPILAAREARLLQRLRDGLKAGTLDGQAALLEVARLCELDELREDLAHTMRQGQRASATLAAGRAG